MRGAIRAEAEKANRSERLETFRLSVGAGAARLSVQTVKEQRQERGGSTGKRPDKCRSQIRYGPWARAVPQQCCRAILWSGKKYTCARPTHTARQKPVWDKHPDTGGNFRTNPAAACLRR